MFWTSWVIIHAVTVKSLSNFRLLLNFSLKCFKCVVTLPHQDLEAQLHNAWQELSTLQSRSSSLAAELSSKEREVAEKEEQLSQVRWALPTKALPSTPQCLFSLYKWYIWIISLVEGSVHLYCADVCVLYIPSHMLVCTAVSILLTLLWGLWVTQVSSTLAHLKPLDKPA